MVVAFDDNKRVKKLNAHGFSLVGRKVAPFVIDQLFVSGTGGLSPPLSSIFIGRIVYLVCTTD